MNTHKCFRKTFARSGSLMVLGFFLLTVGHMAQGALKDQIEAKRKEILKVEKDIKAYEQKVSKKQTEIKTLSSALEMLDNGIDRAASEISRVEKEIKSLSEEIGDKTDEINVLEGKLDGKREKLKNFLILTNEYDRYSTLEVMLKESNLSDFLNELNNLESIESDITEIMEEIKGVKIEIEEDKTELEEQMDEQARLKEMKENQMASMRQDKNSKAVLLSQTKGQEKKYQDLLSKNQQLLPQLREQLLNLQSLGIPINYQEAKNMAMNAGQVTGVRPAYLLGVLKVESDLGNNVGGGTYTRDMAPRQREIFKKITKELGFDPAFMPVSRKPKSYQGWGGAMGPAQIMPDTWMSYKAQIANLTGHNPPNPWNLGDALTGMALKLSNVDGVVGANRDAEYKAAAMYFAGGNWKRFTWYADRVMFYADLYEAYNQSL